MNKFMKPKEKAIELVRKFYHILPIQSATPFDIWAYAKECALLHIHEILDNNIGNGQECGDDEISTSYLYWEEVRNEIKKI